MTSCIDHLANFGYGGSYPVSVIYRKLKVS